MLGNANAAFEVKNAEIVGLAISCPNACSKIGFQVKSIALASLESTYN